MIITEQKITIISTRRPKSRNVNDELRWLGLSLGLFNLRDKDQSCFRVFIELLKSAKSQTLMSSDEIAYKLNLSRGTVVHHINRLMRSGLVVSDKKKYALRVDSLDSLIDEIEKDVNRSIAEMKQVAREVDKYLGL